MCCHWGAVRPHLHLTVPLVSRFPGAPHRTDGLQMVDGQPVGSADDDGVGHRLDVQHVPWLAVRGGDAEVQSPTLADGEVVVAVMATHHGSGFVTDLAPTLTEFTREPSGGVPVGDETDVVGVRLVGHGESELGSLGTDVGLDGVAQGEHRMGELLLVEHCEHVGLVLARVDPPVHPRARGGAFQTGVVAGGHRVESQIKSTLQQGCEFDPLIAAQTRIGGAPGRVLGDEWIDDLLGEPVGEVPHVERNTDLVRCAPCVEGVLQGAAAS